MRQDTPNFWAWTSSPTLVLLVANLSVFLLQSILAVYASSASRVFTNYFALSGSGLLHGYIWQLFTFQFLHGGFWHFFLNAFALYIFGKPTEMTLGRGRFLEIYFAAGVLGGLLQALLGLVLPQVFGTHTVGASAGVFGILAAFCLLYRDATIRLFFVIPIRAYHFLIGMLAFAIFFVLVPTEPGIAHAAHLGGMLSAIAYFHWILRRERRLFNWKPYASVVRAKRRWESRSGTVRRPRPAPRREVPPGEFISREVDPILEKISQHGIHSLTPHERQILEAARSRMRKR